jgi:Domain of unknown function (DUF5615)
MEMPPLLSDENFNNHIVQALRQHPEVDLVRVQDAGLGHTDDPAILAWAATQGRVLLTHDRNTMAGFAYDRVRAGLPMPGVFVVDDRAQLDPVISDILLVVQASQPGEWEGRVEYIPFSRSNVP